MALARSDAVARHPFQTAPIILTNGGGFVVNPQQVDNCPALLCAISVAAVLQPQPLPAAAAACPADTTSPE